MREKRITKTFIKGLRKCYKAYFTEMLNINIGYFKSSNKILGEIKMKTSVNKKSYILLAILTIFVMSPFFTFGNAATSDFTFDIDEFKERIQSSPDELWKKPGEKRKNNICNKLTELQQLIDEENFEDAYDKLLHDIKPKLTGLKQDEDGVPWGNGVYAQSWVTCDDLKAIFLIDCDLILDQINPISVYDDDKTPPTISIVYEGGCYLANIGVWHVIIEDLESGIDEVLIEINGIVFVNEINLDGAVSITYDNIALPFVTETHMIVVTAINNDKDDEWDQESSSETDWVEILEDNTAPIIEIIYQGDNNDENPGTWSVDAFDDESGLNMASFEILIDGQLAGNDFGDYIVPYSPGEHSIHVEVENNDPLNPLLSELSKSTTIIDDDVDSPVIIFSYTGDGTDGNSGEIIVSASDNVGLSVDPSGTYPVPNTLGSHSFLYKATDNDNDRALDSLTTTLTVLIEIVDDDTTAPNILIFYSGTGFDEGVGYINWVITDSDDAVGGNGDIGLSEITVLGTYISTIGLPNEEFILLSTELGTWDLPSLPGTYLLDITATDKDADRTNEVDALSTNLLHEQTIADDDVSAPSISIQYIGDGTVINPGVWHVEVEDLNSGLSEVQFLIGNDQFDFDQDIGGIMSKSYDIPVPISAGEYTLTVVAKNNDNDWNGDQEQSSEFNYIDILGDITPPQIIQPDDITYELISIGNEIVWVATDEHPDTYTVLLDGEYYGEGIWQSGEPVEIDVDGLLLGAYQFSVEFYDTYDNSVTNSVNIIVIEDDDVTGPIIGPNYYWYVYIGSGTDFDPGFWNVKIEDPESGLDEVLILINGFVIDYQDLDGQQSIVYSQIDCPASIHCHWFKTIATNNDLEWIGDQERSAYMDVVKIIPSPIFGLPGSTEPSEWGPPFISIDYNGDGFENNPGVWDVLIEDLSYGIREVKIEIDNEIYLYEENLDGINSITYSIPVPTSLGDHKIEVDVINNGVPGGEYIMGGGANTEYLETLIKDEDTTGPIIILTPASFEITDADAAGGVSVDWQITDPSGINQASVLLNGVEIASYGNADYISGSYLLPSVPGIYIIDIVARDNDNDPEHPGDDWLETSAQTVITIIDDDTELPTISISYTGDYHTENSGVWNVLIEDTGSGLAEVIISVDGNIVIQEANLGGATSKSYDNIAVPATEGVHTIEVTVIDNDNQWDGDPQEITFSQWVIIDPPPIDPGPPPGPPPIDLGDVSPPEVYLDYYGDATDQDPGEWTVNIEDPESGIQEVTILIDGAEYIFETNLGGIHSKSYDPIPVPNTLGVHVIEIIVINGAGLLILIDTTVSIQEAPEDPDPPPIIIL